jgi:hypothetical protein
MGGGEVEISPANDATVSAPELLTDALFTLHPNEY